MEQSKDFGSTRCQCGLPRPSVKTAIALVAARRGRTWEAVPSGLGHLATVVDDARNSVSVHGRLRSPVTVCGVPGAVPLPGAVELVAVDDVGVPASDGDGSGQAVVWDARAFEQGLMPTDCPRTCAAVHGGAGLRSRWP